MARNMLKQIQELMRPPESPIDTEEVWLLKNQQTLSLTFPTDFVEFSRFYGSGEIRIHGGADAEVWSACRPNYPQIVQDSFEIHDCQREAMGAGHLPLGLFPEPGGLLPFGCDSEGDWYLWKTAEKPEDWNVVYMYAYDEGQYQQFEMGFTEFWYKKLTRSLRLLYQNDEEWDPKKDLTFVSRVYYGLDEK